MRRETVHYPAIIAVLLIAWALLMFRVGSEWFGHQENNGAWISVAVRNYQQHGFFELGGIVDLNTHPLGETIPYTHHPPIAVWLAAFPVLLAGYDEAMIRFGAAACTLIGGAAFYALARQLSGRKAALWSMIFYLLTPMMAYFGRMPDHEAPALLFVLLFANVLVAWLRHPTSGKWWALAVLTVLTVWTAWGGVIMLAALGVMALFFTRRRIAVIMLGVVALAALIALLGYYLIFVPDAVTDLIDVFVWRTSSTSFERGSVAFTWGDYALLLVVRLLTLYTPSVIGLFIIGVFCLRYQHRLQRAVPLALLFGGIIYLLIFRNASYIHDYYLIYTAPAIALLAGQGITFVAARHSRFLRPLVTMLLILLLPSTLFYLSQLYGGSDPNQGLEFARRIEAHTTADALIMTSLPTIGESLEFYAERGIEWDTPLEEILSNANAFSGAAYYLNCDPASALPDDVPRLNNVEIAPGCFMIRLR